MTATSDDASSTFSYDGEGVPDTFSLCELRSVVNSHFNAICTIEKLAAGGYHKVYDIFKDDGTSIGIVRVAAPAFPKDKLESEVCLVSRVCRNPQILGCAHKHPSAEVFAWDSDAANPVGAEYMIMEKVGTRHLPGVSASNVWESLAMNLKERVVLQVAEYLMAMFALRFETAGSLYISSDEVVVGPIISKPFYRALDGVARLPQGLSPDDTHRGPFSTTTEYLQSFIHPELQFISQHRLIALQEFDGENEELAIHRLEDGQRILRKTLDLCAVYPGNIQIHDPENSSPKPFSLRLDDFRLSNIMIDEITGRVTGLIDFEGTTTAPLWECALLPRLLQHSDDPEATPEGGDDVTRQALRAVFMDKVANGQWNVLCELGKPFRQLSDRLSFRVDVWASEYMESWVEERLVWAQEHPGIGYTELP
ncbi:hypothetical protein K443DRAFT_665055 [Laccaria amethystina LaAM-08-1]|uniref:Aminoglycoside phosphotransferase domain-containing protein n=1 Tax=Laccaria amethystina LaAM-08-1 TaxID=1095629 RepID=A0A0C9WQH2_9AGAR|nr:hypothetical protein K443DRAFT_665055 [Laccaria amethystina LaAM-08-1]